VHVAADKEAVDQQAAGDGIADVVAHQRAAVAFAEAVLVMPEPVRAMPLLVHEAVRRFPLRDRRSATASAGRATAAGSQSARLRGILMGQGGQNLEAATRTE